MPVLKTMYLLMKGNDFQIDTAKNIDLICAICNRLLINAHNGPCGCRFCWCCIDQYLNGQSKVCPGKSKRCQEEILNGETSIQLDQAINAKISRLVVKCPRESCQHRCELILMEDHMKTCVDQTIMCPFNNVGCNEEKLSFEKIEQHLSMSNYSHIQLLMDWVSESRNEIHSLKKTVKQLRLENNYLKDKIEDLTLDAEKKDAKLRDVELQTKESVSQVEILKRYVVTVEDKYETLKSNFEVLLVEEDNTKQFTNLQFQEKSKPESQEVTKLDEIKQIPDDLSDGNKRRTKEDQTNVASKIQRRSEGNIITDQIDTVDAHRKSSVLEIVNNENMKLISKAYPPIYGEFLWKIESWSIKRKLAQKDFIAVIFSRPFFSHKNGYQMTLKAYPDGDGQYKGTHLCISFGIDRGSFDATLPWPFKYDVTFSVVNQETSSVHTSVTMKYTTNTTNARRRSSNETDIAYGFLPLIRLDELETNSSLYKRDQIVIKSRCEIDGQL